MVKLELNDLSTDTSVLSLSGMSHPWKRKKSENISNKLSKSTVVLTCGGLPSQDREGRKGTSVT